MQKTRLKINLGGMPHLAAGVELELQAKNIAPDKATKVKRFSPGLDLAILHIRVYRSTTEPQSLILKVSSRQSPTDITRS